MDRKAAFTALINGGYACSGDSIILRSAILDGEPVSGTQVKIALKTMSPVVKVLTSATFLRGVMEILKKVI